MKIDMWRVSIEKRGWGLGLVGVLMNWPERLPVVPRSAFKQWLSAMPVQQRASR